MASAYRSAPRCARAIRHQARLLSGSAATMCDSSADASSNRLTSSIAEASASCCPSSITVDARFRGGRGGPGGRNPPGPGGSVPAAAGGKAGRAAPPGQYCSQQPTLAEVGGQIVVGTALVGEQR